MFLDLPRKSMSRDIIICFVYYLKVSFVYYENVPLSKMCESSVLRVLDSPVSISDFNDTKAMQDNSVDDPLPFLSFYRMLK